MENQNTTKFINNDKVTGENSNYPCFAMDARFAKSNFRDKEKLICLSSHKIPKNGHLQRIYNYIGFHETSDDFFKIDLKKFNPYIHDFWFIDASELKKDNIDEIISDIKTKYSIPDFKSNN
jgi:hypothetical protein